MQLNKERSIPKDLEYMLFFGIASYLMGFIYFYTPGIEGGSSNFIEIPLLISVFYLSNPLYLIGVCLLMSFVTPEGGSYWSTFLMHIFPLAIAWLVVRILRKKVKNNSLLGLLWGFYTILHYVLLLIPLLIITNHLFGLNQEYSFGELYMEIMPQITFEMASTVLTTSLFLVLMKAYYELKKHRNQLEELVKKRTKDLRLTNTKLEKNIATKDKLFRIIGHDLRTPIGQVIQFTELMEDGYHDMSEEEVLELTKMLKESSLEGIKLLENLLQWSRTQTDSIQFEPEKVNVYQLLEDSVQVLQKNAALKSIRILNHLNPHKEIWADVNMLQTIFRNLISNAIKFTETGGEIEIGSLEKERALQLYVKDNGVGISKTNIEKLFKVETQHSTEGTDAEKGTGIGLILCKEFVEQHQGKIWVESEEGVGSTFWMSLPTKST